MWRYKVKTFTVEGDGTEEFERFLAEQGQDGWELVTVNTLRGMLFLIFKKPATA